MAAQSPPKTDPAAWSRNRPSPGSSSRTTNAPRNFNYGRSPHKSLTPASMSAPGSCPRRSRRPSRPQRSKTPDRRNKDFTQKKKFLKGLQMGPHDPNTVVIKETRQKKGYARQHKKALRHRFNGVHHQSKPKSRKGLRLGPHDSGVSFFS